MMDFEIKKYPRTPHIEGSRLQPGDEDLSQIPFVAIKGKHIVIEEKVDGANTAISFRDDGELLLQSRGHYLTGGYRERHYELMKQWAAVHRERFHEVIGCRYIMYGEWLYARHRIAYDRLPHYFLEFDILDRETGLFLDTVSRRKITAQMPVCSVPVLSEGTFDKKEDVLAYLGTSNFGPEIMEGLYIKVEESGFVVNRLKYVRPAFSQWEEPEGAWLGRDIVTNGLSVPLSELYHPDYHG